MNPPRRLHTATQSVELLNPAITVSWLQNKARLGEIPHCVISGKYMFSDEHLDEIIRIFERRPAQSCTASPRRPAAKAGDSAVTLLRARKPRRSA